MDVANTLTKERVKDIPPVPIKTYKWEEIRREKRKGRYPYTYLSKEPYNEDIDPNQFKMDTLKTSKSASTLEKSASGVNIEDVTDKSVNNGKDYLDVHEGIVDAPDSSNEDNVSQYLDKEDDPPVITEHLEVPGPSKVDEKMDVDDDKQGERAKSEEPKRKRKLSIESSYSRISLSKLGVMKKLREAKEKLKLPKFSFSKSESKLDIPKQSTERKKSSSREIAKKNLQAYLEPKKDNTPVYIHIPLKPPPGQTDEFSYLEFEERKPDAPSTPATNVDKQDEEKITDTEPTNESGVQFIILTAPSDDETLNPSTPSTGSGKKFFDNVTLQDLKSLPQEQINKISPDMPIQGIIFEDVVQVEYLDEHSRPIGTTETSNILEVTEGNLPKLEKRLSQRNLAKELEQEIASSMDSLHKIARQNTLKKLKEDYKSRSNEALRKLDNNKQRTTQEAPELTTVSKPSADELPKASKVERAKSEKIKRSKPEKGGEPKPEKKDVQTKADAAKIQIVKDVKKEIPTAPVEETQAAGKKAMYDEEDGLKLSEAAVQMINEELAKEKLPKTDEEQLKAAAKTDSAKKKVSFKRRSKQEDPHGVYEDVQVTSDSKKVDGKEQQTKELKVIEPSQSMSVDEEKSYLDDKIIKMTSLEEDYNKWSKVTDHEYEPVNPPAENGIQQHVPSQPPPEVQITDAPVKRTSSKKSPPNSIRIPLTDEVVVQSDEEHESGDALTVEEMQARIEDQFFNQSTPSAQLGGSSTNKTAAASSTASNKENVSQPSQAKKFQDTLKMQTGKLRAKFQNIKAPKINMPQRPNFEKLKIQKPNITLPKIPDQMRVNLPSFTLPKKTTARKRTVKQFSTESNVGDSKKKLFDFSTYPRIFKKKKKPDDFNDDDLGMSATVPRSKKSPKSRRNHSKGAKESEKKRKSPDVIRIPLHSEESMDKEEYDLSSRARYEDENIDMDDAYVRESQQMNTASAINAGDFGRSRWNHGSFHGHNPNEVENQENEPEPPAVTSFQNEPKSSELGSFETEPKSSELDSFEHEPNKNVMLDQEMERPQTSPEPEFEQEMDSRQSDMRSVSSSGEVHRPGVLEKINSNEYFIQIGGNYASSELREAFRQPTNQLAKLQTDDSFDREFDISDQSIQEIPKRRPIRKPKRKKTPNVSRERIPYDQESEPDEYPQPYTEQPARPKRKSKQKKNLEDDKPPYQETIFVPEQQFEVMRKSASDNILLTDRGMEDNFHNGHFRQEYSQLYENERMQGIEQPNILISSPYYKQAFRYPDEHSVPLQRYENGTPEAPPRKRSLKSLVSEHDSIIDEINLPEHETSQPNIDMTKLEHEYIIPTPDIPPIRPARTRSRTRSHSRATSQPEDEQQQLPETEQPCVEEPCVQQVCDYMGYAVIEKNRHREPPLPPPTRKKRATAKNDGKFFTVPRPLKEEAPVRPIRNYSTLVPKGSRSPTTFGKDEKENLDLGQYIEIEDDDEDSRLQSGEIVQKMKDRPLPAPPRPPRKTKDSDKDAPFKDITNKNDLDEEEELPVKAKLEEAEASVQTEPLPDDVVCEELVQEKGDKIIIPTPSKYHQPITEFENVETVTHGALVVTPVPEDFQEGPITSFSRSTERIITIRREVENENESKIPSSFMHAKESQPTIIERIIERPIASSPEIEVLKAQKLQVSDLDVDRLMVNELLASKIKVSEIDSDSISVTEINPKSGNLVIGGLELPASLIQDILNKLKSAQTSHESQSPTSQQEPECQNKDARSIRKESEGQSQIVSDSITESIEIEKPTVTSEKQLDLTKNLNNLPQKLEESDKLPTKEYEKSSIEFDEPASPMEEELPIETEEKLSKPDSDLSPTTLKTTIEYLDDLLIEENKRQEIEESARKIVQDVLQAAVDSNTISPTLQGEQEYPFLEQSESSDLQEVPPLVPDTSEEERLIQELKSDSAGQKKTPIEKLDDPPKRPPRQSDIHRLQQSQEDIFIPSQIIENSHNILLSDTPPPRPPDPEERLYLRSQPPPSFYVLRSPALDDFVDEDIPLPPRRKRPPRPPSRSTSEEEAPPATPRTRRHRTPEPSIPQLTGQLTRACATASQKAFKRLVKHVTMNILRNADGKQDLHVMILILLILIAGLILLGNGGSPIVHHHHWEYFNPPRDL